MKRFDRDAAQIIDIPQVKPELPPGVGRIQRDVPTRAPEVGSDVLVPLCRAIISGAFLFAIVGVLVIVLDWLPWYAACLAGGVAAMLVWFGKGLSDKLLWATETITGADIDRDGQVGRPSFEIVERIERPHGQQYKMFDLPGEPEMFAKVCYGTLTGSQRLTQAVWAGKNKPYSRAEWDDLCDMMVARGWWAWNNPDHHPSGIAPLPEGKRKMAQWLGEFGRHTNTRAQATGGLLDSPAPGAGEWGNEDE